MTQQRDQFNTALLGSAITAIHTGLVLLDHSSGTAQVSPVAAALLDLDAGEQESAAVYSALGKLQMKAGNLNEVADQVRQLTEGYLAAPAVCTWLFEDSPTHLKVTASGFECEAAAGTVIEFVDLSEEKRLQSEEQHNASALRQVQELYRFATEHAGEAMLMGDDQGVLLWASPSITRLTGWQPEQVINRPFIELVDASDRDLVRQFQQQLPHTRVAELETRLRTADGGSKWVGLSVQQGEHPQTGKQMRVGVCRDISEQVAAQEALAASERMLKAMVDQVDAVIAYRGSDEEVPRLSGHTLRMLGIEESQVTIQDWRDWLHPDDLPAALEVWDGGARSWELEYRVRRSDGEYIWVLDRSRQVLADDGGYELFGILVDITALKELEERLVAANRDLAEAQRIAKVGSWSLDVESDSLEWSDELFRIFNMIPTEDHKVDFSSFADAPGQVGEKIKEFIANAHEGKPWDYVYSIVRNDGAELFLHSRGELRSEGGGKSLIKATVADITEEELERAHRARRVARRSEYLAKVEHILRTHVSVIQGWAELLEDPAEASNADVSARGRVAIKRNSDALLATVNYLMDESRWAIAAESLTVHPVDATALATTVAEEYRPLHSEVSIGVSNQPHAIVMCDDGALETVLRHLLENALRYASSQVYVGFEMRERNVAIVIQDDGPGLPPEFSFEAQSAAFSDKADGSGHGLGLHVVRTLVEAMGGEVIAANIPDRPGARLEVLLRTA